MGCDDEEVDLYMVGKLQDRGYPGIQTTSFAANNTRGIHTCDFCGNPINPVMVHDCYEKRNGIKVNDGIIGTATPEMYRPHPFNTNAVDGKCVDCGGNRDAVNHSNKAEPINKDKALHVLQQPMVSVERYGPRHVTIEILNIPNDQALRVVAQVLPKALELYLKKSADYGGNVMDRFGLGQRAAIPDMARKFGKLIDNIWHDKPLAFEQADEILMDLLGHIFIILDQRRNVDMDDLYETEMPS